MTRRWRDKFSSDAVVMKCGFARITASSEVKSWAMNVHEKDSEWHDISHALL